MALALRIIKKFIDHVWLMIRLNLELGRSGDAGWFINQSQLVGNGINQVGILVASVTSFGFVITAHRWGALGFLICGGMFLLALWLAGSNRSKLSRIVTLTAMNFAMLLSLALFDLSLFAPLMLLTTLLMPVLLLPEVHLFQIRRTMILSMICFGLLGIAKVLETQSLNGVSVLQIASLGLLMAVSLWAIRQLFYRLSLVKELHSKTAFERNILVGTMTHDIANHLAIVQGILKFLERDYQLRRSSQGTKYYDRAIRSFFYLTNLIGRFKEGHGLDAKDPVNSLEVITTKEIKEFIDFCFGELLVSKGLQLTYIDEWQDRVGVLADSTIFLNSIVGNVFSNACKFSPPGGRILVRFGQNESEILSLTIEDQGVGMTIEECQVLFTDEPNISLMGTTGEAQSVGLGLILARHWLHKMDGRIFIDSVVNVGTKIKIDVPSTLVQKEEEAIQASFGVAI